MDLSLSRLNLVGFTRSEARYNMALDRYLLDLGEAEAEAAGGAPDVAGPAREGYLRFYDWERPTISLGHCEPAENIDIDKALEDGLEIVRRPTGGRAVLHWGDLTYAVVLPARTGKDLSELYKLIAECIIEGARLTGLDLDLERGTLGKSGARDKPCFASVSRHEISYRGRKVVGSAQRIGEGAMLQHGSIPVDRSYLRIVDYMKFGGTGDKRRARERLRRELEASTACLEDASGGPLDPAVMRAALAQGFQTRLGCEVAEIDPPQIKPGLPAEKGAESSVSRRKP
ncbi:biotin/lipoate A/B protein ligase family protein [Candidatus Eisenbacteria bacterium]|uniref:Biotin/lipoate A/B protein ligase family protein n=1 Tax=Eiseniibacteriota bacterium TaxID=2212470 RepID=A0ABV6YP65_UNCEI